MKTPNMTKRFFSLCCVVFSLSIISVAWAGSKDSSCSTQGSATIPAATANGIEFPVNYQEWDVIGVSHRADNNTMRVILGNPAAMRAIAEGKTNPWPDGVILGKMVWNNKEAEYVEGGTIPGNFHHAEFMFKDAKKWEKTGGWGWARWLGMEQKPFGKDANGAQESCLACHAQVEDNDWAFTEPAMMPKKLK